MAGGAYARYDALQLSAPVALAMAARARPNLIVWGQPIPQTGVSNIARELVFEASLGHPFAATGARILSQAAKELALLNRGARAVVSLCADGGQGTVALPERA